MLDKVLRRMRRENTLDYFDFMVKITSALHQSGVQSTLANTTTAHRTATHITTAHRTAETQLLLGERRAVMEEFLARHHPRLLQEFQSGSLDFGEDVAERAEQTSTADITAELLASRRRGEGSTNNVLLTEDTLYDTAAAPNGFKKSAVRRDDEELGLDTILTRVVEDGEVELEGEVAHQTRCLTRL